MRLLHIANLSMSLNVGPTYSVPSYVNAQNEIKGVTSDLLLTSKFSKQNKGFYYKQNFEKNLDYIKFITSYNIIIFHSTYIPEYVKISRILKKNKIPYIIVPRGGFSQGAKKVKRFKKEIADFIMFNSFFLNACAIQFLTEKEKESSIYRTVDDFVLPNGIEMPITKVKKSINGPINFVYIGRIDSYHKGLDILIEAISLIKKELNSYKVTINLYGTDTRGSKKKLLQLIQKHGLESQININEPVYLKEKQKILLNSHIFIQTSRFEGLPMGILEALSFGIPCILTPGTNISEEVKNNNAGIAVEENPLSISQGILDLLKKIHDYYQLSNNAISLAEKYSWNEIAQKSIHQYQNIINRNYDNQ